VHWPTRAGLKLEAALEHFGVDVAGLRCLDAGLSTGGFADCLLQRGAAHVVGVDVGYGQACMRAYPVSYPNFAGLPAQLPENLHDGAPPCTHLTHALGRRCSSMKGVHPACAACTPWWGAGA
jgi:hypothetical protein